MGLLVLFGWHTHNLRLLHLHPAFVAMAYNTALGFFVCGMGLLAIALHRPRFALIGGVYGVACGSLTLGEYLFHSDFHIDELFMRAYTVAGVTNNARMAFATAVCFLLLGIFQLLFVRQIKAPWLLWSGALIGSLVLGLGAVALSGYFIGIQSYYAWGQFTRMALHTALGFVTLGVGVLAYVWQRGQEAQPASSRWLPLPVGVGVLALSVSLWQALIVEQSVQLDWLRHLAGGTTLPASLLRMNTLIPQAALVIGVLFAFLLALLVSLAQSNQQRALLLGSVNGELNAQVQIREEAEAALLLANDTLESRVLERMAEVEALNHRLRRAMSETHHRVKNNLQVIAALVDLQRMEGSEFVPMREMERLGQHVSSLAVIHDLLTQQAKLDEQVTELEMSETVAKLAPLLQAMLPDRVIRANIAAMRQPIRPGTSLTILINELVSNAGKHGQGDIEIDLMQEGENGRLVVRDHGAGFPPGFDPRKAASTGLDLIQSLTQWDLRGTFDFENAEDGGARIVINFPLDTPQEPHSEVPA